MNQRLAEHRIRTTCRELIAGGGRVTGRALRRELRSRFGAVGRTARVFQIWREELAPPAPAPNPSLSHEEADLPMRLQAAQAVAAEHLARAELAEFREQAHQAHWAMEIDRLREQLRARPQYAAEIRTLQDRVLRLTAELQAARSLRSRQD